MLRFTKLEGCGNDFLVVDLRGGRDARAPDPMSPEVVRALSLRAGRLWESTGKSELAEARYQALLVLDREDGEALEARVEEGVAAFQNEGTVRVGLTNEQRFRAVPAPR